MNLIVTCARHLEPETEEEIKVILDKFGDSNAKSFNYKNVRHFNC